MDSWMNVWMDKEWKERGKIAHLYWQSREQMVVLQGCCSWGKQRVVAREAPQGGVSLLVALCRATLKVARLSCFVNGVVGVSVVVAIVVVVFVPAVTEDDDDDEDEDGDDVVSIGDKVVFSDELLSSNITTVVVEV